jgi:transcriptional regulator with PAS, ATPase and Fis domain
VVTLKIPALRERKDDLAILSRFFIQRYAKEFGKTIKDIDPESLETFTNYDWPGNVRELRIILERAVMIASEEVIRPKHLPSLLAGL